MLCGADYVFTKFFDEIWEYNGFVITITIIGGVVNTCLLGTIFFMSCGISFSHTLFALGNATTLESMGMSDMNTMFEFERKENQLAITI